MVRGERPDDIYARYLAAQRSFQRSISSGILMMQSPVTKFNIGLVGVLILTEDPAK